MSYATYEFYTNTYYGDVLSAEDFEKYASRASDYLDRLTMNRAKDYDDTDRSLAKACCVAAEQLSAISSARLSAGSGEYASESVGSHSVSYRSGIETAAALEKDMKNLVEGYLLTTGLLYRGIPCIRRIP